MEPICQTATSSGLIKFMWLVYFFCDAWLSGNRLNNDLLERTLVNLCQNQRHNGDVISEKYLNIFLIVKNWPWQSFKIAHIRYNHLVFRWYLWTGHVLIKSLSSSVYLWVFIIFIQSEGCIIFMYFFCGLGFRKEYCKQHPVPSTFQFLWLLYLIFFCGAFFICFLTLLCTRGDKKVRGLAR